MALPSRFALQDCETGVALRQEGWLPLNADDPGQRRRVLPQGRKQGFYSGLVPGNPDD